MKIRPVGAELFHADERTDRHDEANGRSLQFYERAWRWPSTLPCTNHFTFRQAKPKYSAFWIFAATFIDRAAVKRVETLRIGSTSRKKDLIQLMAMSQCPQKKKNTFLFLKMSDACITFTLLRRSRRTSPLSEIQKRYSVFREQLCLYLWEAECNLVPGWLQLITGRLHLEGRSASGMATKRMSVEC
jgi:hypothetical protein